MRAVRLNAYVRQASFFECDVASRTTVDHAELRQPDLLNAGFKVTVQGDCVAAVSRSSSDTRAGSGANR